MFSVEEQPTWKSLSTTSFHLLQIWNNNFKLAISCIFLIGKLVWSYFSYIYVVEFHAESIQRLFGSYEFLSIHFFRMSTTTLSYAPNADFCLSLSWMEKKLLTVKLSSKVWQKLTTRIWTHLWTKSRRTFNTLC